MESEFTLTTDEIWKNTIRTVESAYCWLLTYEGKDYELVEDTITAMRKLITHGKTYEDVKTFDYANLLKQSTTKYVPYKKQQYTFVPISYDLEPNWQQIDENTIEVQLEGGEKASAIVVTNEQQLDQVIKDIYTANCVAVDCEFLGLKKTLPELKLLQIGVSKEKGYAIQVDIIGFQIIADKLKPVLEDENLNIVGWSFRGDALAIESYITGIELAPVLDLQAKLRPIAVENLNLSNALNGYASEWVGNKEFQKAKQCGAQFIFTGKECVWLTHPLPPKALVYAVFDVLSVVALYEHTLQYPSDENFYWPYTVTSTATQRSLDKWHIQRAKGISSSSSQGIVNIVSTKPLIKRKNGKQNAITLSPSVISPPTDDGYNDGDVRFRRALQVALERSVKDSHPRPKSGESNTDHIVSSKVEEMNYSDLIQDLDADSYNRDNDNLRFSEVPVKESTTPEIVTSTWGIESLDDQPFFGGAFNRQIHTTSDASPVTSLAQNPPTILKCPHSPAIQKSDQRIDAYIQSPQNPHTVILSTESSIPAANKQWKNDTFSLHAESSTPLVNKQLKNDTTTKGQWNRNATPKHQWSITDNENTGQWEDAKNNVPHNKQWSNNNSAAGSPKKWGDNNNTASANSQWNNSNIAAGSSSQWGESNASSAGNRQKNNAGYNSPKSSNLLPRVSESQANLTLTASQSATRNSPALSSEMPSPEHRSLQSQHPSCKPDKNKYTNDLKSRINAGSQSGSFTWAPSTKNEMSSASWKSFVNSSISDWKAGKDTTLDAIQSTIEDTSPTPEPIKFNTTVQSNYRRGGDIGDTSTGKMKEMDNWSHQEDRPDTMQMPMNQIPIRTKFSGPKVTNPNDEMADDHDDDNNENDGYNTHSYNDSDFPILKMNMDIQDKSQQRKIQGIESLPTFVDGIFLYSEEGDAELSMYRLTKPEHLDMINMPPPGTDYTATVCYHFISANNKRILKAIQIHLSTGDSYTAIIEKTFRMKRPGALKNTKFGQLLMDPSIKRVCWCPNYIEEDIYKVLGFTIGTCVDLMLRANYGRSENNLISFVDAIDCFLANWPDKQQYIDAKADFEALYAKKFSSTCWDREKLPDAVLTYCALQGLAAYTLYQQTLRQIDAPDSYFSYEPEI